MESTVTKPERRRDRLGGRKTLNTGILEEIEKEQVKKEADLVGLFEAFGVTLSKKGKSHMGKCPWHEDSSPSLSVDSEKGLYHCFGCGESGDVFSLVGKMKGLDFKGSLSFLRGGDIPKPSALPIGPASAAPAPPPILLEEETVQEAPQNLLDRVARFYQNGLQESPEAQEYLRSRGLTDTALWGEFGLGFATGGLAETLSDKEREALLSLGIFRESGREHLEGSITVPLVGRDGSVVGFYGRRVGDGEPRHLYLKGKHRGLVNPKAAEIYRDSLILTESVIDGLSLYALGLKNVIPCYGTSGFTEEHRRLLREAGVAQVVLAFDADEAGRAGAGKIAAELTSLGYEVKRIELVGFKDFSEGLAGGLTRPQVEHLIAEAKTEGGREKGDEPRVKREGKTHLFTFADVHYRVVPATLMGTSLRVTIRAEAAGELHLDTLDLYSARGRMGFASALARMTGYEAVKLERELLFIVDALEKAREAEFSGKKDEVEKEITDDEKAEALAFLSSADLFDRISLDLETLGYVGEAANKMLAYLAAVSRLLEKPLSVYIQAGSSSGKSFLLETVRKLLPSEAVLAVTSFSDQALNYMRGEDFSGKVMLLGEAVHNEIVEAQIRQMQSEGELSRLVVVKDPNTGELESRQVRHKVSLSFMMSSTALYLNPENASRCLVLHTDESRGQTERILHVQRKKKTFEGFAISTGKVPEIIRLHQNAQRLLRRIPVFNPLAAHLSFPVFRPTMRRTQEQFLTLLEAVALLRQYQKKEVRQRNPHTGESISGIEVDLTDYRLCRGLFAEAVLKANAEELPSGAKLLYQMIRTMAERRAKKEDLSPTEVSFIQRDVREVSELGSDSIKKYLRTLVDFEYLELISGRRHGTRFSYRLRDPGEAPEVDLGLPSPEELESRLASGLDSSAF